jgi:hypothetical protein
VRCPRELAAQCRVAWIGAVSASLPLSHRCGSEDGAGRAAADPWSSSKAAAAGSTATRSLALERGCVVCAFPSPGISAGGS